jgi:hypothetical protein
MFMEMTGNCCKSRRCYIKSSLLNIALSKSRMVCGREVHWFYNSGRSQEQLLGDPSFRMDVRSQENTRKSMAHVYSARRGFEFD